MVGVLVPKPLGFEHDLNYSHWIESVSKLLSQVNITDGELYNSPLAIKRRSMKIPPCRTKINQLPWWSRWASDNRPPRWCGSKEAAHTCDLVREGAWSFDTEFSWRTPLPQGRLEIQVLWMMIWQIWWYRIMMFHAPVNQWGVLVCMLSLQAMNVMSHKHHDITNPSSYQ